MFNQFEKIIFQNRNQIHFLDRYVLDEHNGILKLFLLDDPESNDLTRIVVVFSGISDFKKAIYEDEEEDPNLLQQIIGIDECPIAKGRYLIVIATDICEMELETNGLPSVTGEK